MARDPLGVVLDLAVLVFAVAAVAVLLLAGERLAVRCGLLPPASGGDGELADEDLMTAVVCQRCHRAFEDERHGQWQPIGPLHARWLCHGCAAQVRRSGEWSLP